MVFHRLRQNVRALSNRRLLVTLMLGFSSGLPLALTGATLQAWMASESVDIRTIGLFTLAGIPYTWKFLWSPFMDRYAMPFLGRRRGWMLATQGLLAGLLLWLGTLSVRDDAGQVALVAILVAFASASQDIVVDAYRTDLLHPAERGLGAGLAVMGYRIAMIFSGALALLAAAFWGWQATYWLMALLMVVGMLATFLGPEPAVGGQPPATLREAVWQPLLELALRPQALLLLALVVFYKLGDAFAGALTTAFLIKGAGFGIAEVGAVNKGVGMAATIAGVLTGGALMVRWKLYRALLRFGFLQGVAVLAFAALAAVGHELALMVVAVFLENFTAGMGTAAFTALLMALCDHRYSATQFALLSALSAIGRVYVGPLSGLLVAAMGWTNFFVFAALMALPGLWLVARQRALLERL
jgi:PAT family beta-lactamase induction signal transducer AmpG